MSPRYFTAVRLASDTLLLTKPRRSYSSGRRRRRTVRHFAERRYGGSTALRARHSNQAAIPSPISLTTLNTLGFCRDERPRPPDAPQRDRHVQLSAVCGFPVETVISRTGTRRCDRRRGSTPGSSRYICFIYCIYFLYIALPRLGTPCTAGGQGADRRLLPTSPTTDIQRLRNDIYVVITDERVFCKIFYQELIRSAGRS